jgi:alpha-L-fucosidase
VHCIIDLGMGDAWFWWYWKGVHDKTIGDYMKKNYPQDWTYADFASQFRADLFDPKQWANIFKQSGAKYEICSFCVRGNSP